MEETLKGGPLLLELLLGCTLIRLACLLERPTCDQAVAQFLVGVRAKWLDNK